MGKTTTAAMFRQRGIAVHDADARVHAFMAQGGDAVAPIAAAFPGVEHHQAIDRLALRQRVAADPLALRRLEAIIHPLVRADRGRFLARQRGYRNTLVVLDVPLLLESPQPPRVDCVVVVTAPAFLQRQRVLARPRMTVAAFNSLLTRQMPDWQKRQRADVVIPTGLGRAVTGRAVGRLIKCLRTQQRRICHA